MENTYTQKMRCANCGYRGEKEFDKGTLSNGFYECPNCGCREYSKVGYIPPQRKDEIML